MSGSQICADMHPNSTWLVSQDTTRGSRLDKPENLWGLCDWRSFYWPKFYENTHFWMVV